MPIDPRKPNETEDDVLPPLPEDLAGDEVLIPLDSGEPEPVGELPFLEDALHDDVPDFELSPDEPVSTVLDLTDIGALLDPASPLDLEDFATQEELPTLPWRLDVVLLESGRVVPAQLEPTRATTVLEGPDESGPDTRVTLRIRMLDIAVALQRSAAPDLVLRIGRDVLAGRLLIRVDQP